MGGKRKIASGPAPEQTTEAPVRQLPAPFQRKRKRKGGRHTRVVFWHRHLCDGGLHAVGVTSKGQLVFSHHTIAELKRQATLLEFGEETHKCCKLYRAWRLGLRDDPSVKPEMVKERRVWNIYETRYQTDPKTKRQVEKEILIRPDHPIVLAHKICRKRRSKRDPAAYARSELPDKKSVQQYDKDAGKYKTVTVDGVGEEACEQIRTDVAALLRSWGWSAEVAGDNVRVRMNKAPGQHDFNYEATEHFDLVRIKTDSTGGNHYLAVHVWSHSGACDLTVGVKTRNDYDLRYVAEAAEEKLVREMIRRHREFRYAADVAALRQRAVALTKQLGVEGLDVVVDNEKAASFKIVMTQKDSSAHGVYRAAKALVTLAGASMKSFMGAGRKRLKAKMRTPLVPGYSLAANLNIKNPKETFP